jgi:hypothetical protein
MYPHRLNPFSLTSLVWGFLNFCTLSIGSSGGGGNSTDPQVGQAALMNAQIGQDVWNNYKETYLPKEQQWADDSFNYDTPERREKEAGLAQADVQKAVSNQRGQSERNLASMGVDPTSGKFADANAKGDIAAAVQEAGAANTARRNVEQQGYARKQDVISIGKGMPGTASTAVTNSANNAAQNAQLNMQANQNASTNTANTVGGAVNLASATKDWGWWKDGGKISFRDSKPKERHFAMGGYAGIGSIGSPAGLQQIANNGATIQAPVVRQPQQSNPVVTALQNANTARKVVNMASPASVAESLNATDVGRAIRDGLDVKDWAVKTQMEGSLAKAPKYDKAIDEAREQSFQDAANGEEPGLSDASPEGPESFGDDPTTTTEIVTDNGAEAGTEAGTEAATEVGTEAATEAGTDAAATAATETAATAGAETAAAAGAAGAETAAASGMAAMGPVGWAGLGAMAIGSLLSRKDGGPISADEAGAAPGLGDVSRKDLVPGGKVAGPGTETSDSIPARLSDGEVVENAKAVDLAGENTLVKINDAGKKARYGQVSEEDAGLEIARLMIKRGNQILNQHGARK